MTQQEIIEGNKLINDFLASGIDPIPSGMKNEIISGDYHTDMDILILVCDKIKKFEHPPIGGKEYAGCCEVTIELQFQGSHHRCSSYIYGSAELWREKKWERVWTPHIINKDVRPSIALWLSLVEFIKWYNSLSK